ncbi:hypothetical protein D3C85_1774940 [compost metagenome]
MNSEGLQVGTRHVWIRFDGGRALPAGQANGLSASWRSSPGVRLCSGGSGGSVKLPAGDAGKLREVC